MKQPRRTWRRAVLIGAGALTLGLSVAPAAGATTNVPAAPTSSSAPGAVRPGVAESDTPVRSTTVGVSAVALGIGGFAFGLARRARSSARDNGR
jgi:uncharacterized protein HemX